jgi:hypothetical protein
MTRTSRSCHPRPVASALRTAKTAVAGFEQRSKLTVFEKSRLSGEIYIGGTRHLSARDTARKYCYVRDYVARLCRQGKVAGRQLGRLWYVDVDSFASFLKHNNRSEPEPAHSAI